MAALAKVWDERLNKISALGTLIERAVHSHDFMFEEPASLASLPTVRLVEDLP